jgi:hypothetical protein
MPFIDPIAELEAEIEQLHAELTRVRQERDGVEALRAEAAALCNLNFDKRMAAEASLAAVRAALGETTREMGEIIEVWHGHDKLNGVVARQQLIYWRDRLAALRLGKDGE